MSLWRQSTRPSGESRFNASLGMSSGPWIQIQRSGFADIDATEIDTALQSVAIRTAIDLIASLGSELPVHVFRGRRSSMTELDMPRWLEDPAGDGNGLHDWCYQVLMSWLLRGNVYGRELDRESGHMTQMEIYHPDSVNGWVENGRPKFSVNGRTADDKFVHKRVNPIPGHALGLSPIAYHASTIGLSLTGQQFGLQWFRDGAHPTTVLSSSERTVDEPLARKVKERFMAALRGRREPVVLDRGWEADQIQISPEESQFLETQGYSAAECARIYGPGIPQILGYETGGSLTYSNQQENDLFVLKYSVNKWLRRLERLLSEFLPRPQYVRIDRDAMLETTTLQRYQTHASALTNRWKVVNEVRASEDLEAVSWGDEPNATPGAAEADDDDNDGDGSQQLSEEFESARGLTELIQKVYLGTPEKVVLSSREAREILNRAGARLDLDVDLSASDSDEEEND